ncbi:MAG: ferritin [Gemmatimonadetes bacterium]|nr:ferritin [Gemmatimonadota bacterium]
MKIEQAMQAAINEQIAAELESAYIYLSMSAHFEAENFPGFARWMRLQSQEEVAHAMRLFDYLNERGGRVQLKAIAQPPLEFGAPVSVFEQALGHEQKISSLIDRLYETAKQQHDNPTQVMLQWFIKEQVEEENHVGQVVDQMRLAGDNRAALLFLDGKLGARSGD